MWLVSSGGGNPMVEIRFDFIEGAIAPVNPLIAPTPPLRYGARKRFGRYLATLVLSLTAAPAISS